MVDSGAGTLKAFQFSSVAEITSLKEEEICFIIILLFCLDPVYPYV